MRGTCKFALVLSNVCTKNCADYFVLLHSKIVILNCGHIFVFMATFGIKHTGSFICFVSPFMFKLSSVIWKHWVSLDDFTIISGVIVKHGIHDLQGIKCQEIDYGS